MPNFEEPKQDLLFTDSINASEGYEKEEICFGIRFPSEKARRAHFTEELRKKLRDPGFRKIEGFPIGDDEDILKLSDPPIIRLAQTHGFKSLLLSGNRKKTI
jgi:hypothetical protein